MGDRGQGENRQKLVGELARVKWPGASNKTAWENFDEDVDKILEMTLTGSIDKKIESMATLIHAVGEDRFGVEEKREAKRTERANCNRRQREIKSIRKELRQLTRQYKKADALEQSALEELRMGLRERLKMLRRAENRRKKRKERQKRRAQFIANPFQFMKRLFGEKKSGKLGKTQKEVEEHLKAVHCDERKGEDLGECEKLLRPDPPKSPFDEGMVKLQEVKDIIKKARAASAPGPNGVSYKVYKNCLRLTKRLWKLMKVLWRNGRVAKSWMTSGGCFIPKEEAAKEIKQFRTISLLNVEDKIFLAVFARRLTAYLLRNNYMDIAVQKGGIPGISGCVEHTSVLTQIIQEAKENKGDLAHNLLG